MTVKLLVGSFLPHDGVFFGQAHPLDDNKATHKLP